MSYFACLIHTGKICDGSACGSHNNGYVNFPERSPHNYTLTEGLCLYYSRERAKRIYGNVCVASSFVMQNNAN
jgi:hypothetical protein